jgi:hypothetical protein
MTWVERIHEALDDRHLTSEAEFLSNEGRIDHLQLDYLNAAARYGDAADLTANFDRHAAWDFLIRQAYELFNHNQGNEFGDNDAFRRAIVILEQSFAFLDRSASYHSPNGPTAPSHATNTAANRTVIRSPRRLGRAVKAGA